MTTLKARFLKACELPLPGRHSSGVMVGIQKENARLRKLLAAAAELIDATATLDYRSCENTLLAISAQLELMERGG